MVADLPADRPEWVIANGQVIVLAGVDVGHGASLATTERGQAALRERVVESRTVQPGWL